MKVIFDCNVLVSAFILRGSTPRLCWDKAKKHDEILASKNTFNELSRVFILSKFDKYLNRETRLEFILHVQKMVKIVSVEHSVKICRDPHDNIYLELALSGKADCIVTGDPDLLVLDPFENIPIITPKEFLDRFQ